jgi:hypothetical protein
LTIAGALIGAWLQGRREHKRWMRERRLDAYRNFLGAMDAENYDLVLKGKLDPAYTIRTSAVAAEVSLLGPKRVNAAGQALFYALADRAAKIPGARERFKLARWDFLLAAGKVLKVRNVEKSLDRVSREALGVAPGHVHTKEAKKTGQHEESASG